MDYLEKTRLSVQQAVRILCKSDDESFLLTIVTIASELTKAVNM